MRHRSFFQFVTLFVLASIVVGSASPIAPRTRSLPQRAAASIDLSGLPIAAQAAISTAVGDDRPAYHAIEVPGGWRMSNPTHHVTATFQADRVPPTGASDCARTDVATTVCP
jgi:hypothetical protein